MAFVPFFASSPEGRRRAAESDAVTFWRAASSFTGEAQPRLFRRSTQAMKFLCLAYPGRGFSPGPDLVAKYAAPARPWGRRGYSSTDVNSAPATPPRLSGSPDGQADAGHGPPPGSGPQPSAHFVIDCPDLRAALGWAARIPAASYSTAEVRPHEGQDHARLHCLPHRHP